MLPRRSFLASAACLATGCSTLNFSVPPYKNEKLPIEKRAEDLLRRLTSEEKLDLLSGGGWMETRANARLGIPAIHMADGPMGIRAWAAPDAPDTPEAPKTVRATAFPAGIAIAATWNPDLAMQQGRVIGQEAIALGRDQILGPTVNIQRTPLWGRNFESYGEDPWLTSRMAVAYISGIQEQGVLATVKHFAANNQEFRRHTVDVNVPERALQEIYLPAFQASVEEAGVWSVMAAYNKVNGAWCTENPYLLTEILKKKWGFKGFVVSDWAATHGTETTVNAGLDVEMPAASAMPGLLRHFNDAPGGNPGFDGGHLTKDKLRPLLASHAVGQASIDDSVRRILRAMFASGLFDRKRVTDGPVDTPEQRAVARAAAVQSIVLLKNERAALPLLKNEIRTIAVIGPNADVNRLGGGGSSAVTPAYSWKPLDGIRERAGSDFTVGHARG
ncbi:MAG: glycoside hydrolase family 3 protein, partial [Acidobacteriota bacterium]